MVRIVKRHIGPAIIAFPRPSAPPIRLVPNAFQLKGNLAEVERLIGFVTVLAPGRVGIPIKFFGMGVAPNSEVPVATSSPID